MKRGDQEMPSGAKAFRCRWERLAEDKLELDWIGHEQVARIIIVVVLATPLATSQRCVHGIGSRISAHLLASRKVFSCRKHADEKEGRGRTVAFGVAGVGQRRRCADEWADKFAQSLWAVRPIFLGGPGDFGKTRARELPWRMGPKRIVRSS